MWVNNMKGKEIAADQQVYIKWMPQTDTKEIQD